MPPSLWIECRAADFFLQNGSKEYCVKWRGYPFYESPWEKEDVSDDLVAAFRQHDRPPREALQIAVESLGEALQHVLRTKTNTSRIHLPMTHPVEETETLSKRLGGDN